jgi:DNA-binding NarL/FixJ family response regulator
MGAMMNVFIAEGSAVLCNSLQGALSGISGINVVGHAVNEAAAIERIDALLPDAVILGIGLQSGTGIGVLKDIKKHHAEIKVLMLANYAEEVYVDHCLCAGADYFFDISSQFMQFSKVLRELAHTNRLDNKFRPE